MLSQFQALQAAAARNGRHCYLWTLTNILRLVFNMANEAGLESVLSAAYSLKHETDMKKSFPSRSLIKVAQTEQGRSEVSRVLEEVQRVVMAKPMIFSDETRPTNFTFAIKLVCRPMKGHQTLQSLMNLLAQYKVTCGLPTWQCHLALRQPCQQLRSCHSNRIQMDYYDDNINFSMSKMLLCVFIRMVTCLECYGESFQICTCLLSFLVRQVFSPT